MDFFLFIKISRPYNFSISFFLFIFYFFFSTTTCFSNKITQFMFQETDLKSRYQEEVFVLANIQQHAQSLPKIK